MSSTVINLGGLSSIAQLHYLVSGPLSFCISENGRGEPQTIIWDFRNIEPGRISLSALTALVSIADWVRLNTTIETESLIDWSPSIFGFWKDIGFFKITKKLGLFNFDDEIIEGYPYGQTNPHTKLFFYPYEKDKVPKIVNDPRILALIEDWKLKTVWEEKRELLFILGPLFGKKERELQYLDLLIDTVAWCCAEMITNSWLHGRSTCFLGVQRSPGRVTVSVCDSGVGFLNSIKAQLQIYGWPSLRSSTQAILLACTAKCLTHFKRASIINERLYKYGLYHAIDQIVGNPELWDGQVTISSEQAEVHWRAPMWNDVISNIDTTKGTFKTNNIRELLGDPMIHKPSFDEKNNGFYRNWRAALNGVRIEFDLRLKFSQKQGQ